MNPLKVLAVMAVVFMPLVAEASEKERAMQDYVNVYGIGVHAQICHSKVLEKLQLERNHVDWLSENISKVTGRSIEGAIPMTKALPDLVKDAARKHLIDDPFPSFGIMDEIKLFYMRMTAPDPSDIPCSRWDEEKTWMVVAKTIAGY